MPDFWLTHPLTTERMVRRGYVPISCQVRSKIYDLDFEILKWYTQVVLKSGDRNPVTGACQSEEYRGLIGARQVLSDAGDYTQAQSNF